jgi:hypothetical protein
MAIVKLAPITSKDDEKNFVEISVGQQRAQSQFTHCLIIPIYMPCHPVFTIIEDEIRSRDSFGLELKLPTHLYSIIELSTRWFPAQEF